MGMAGIPAASLVGIAVILAAVGLPAEAIGVLLVFDRILDMCRTAINVLADAACTVIVARLEGETGILPAVNGDIPDLLAKGDAPRKARPLLPLRGETRDVPKAQKPGRLSTSGSCVASRRGSAMRSA
jgi:hypothetical protein